MLSDVQAVDLSRIAELVEQLILILLQKSANHSSSAQGSETAKDDFNHQGLAGEAVSSGRTHEKVESRGMLKPEAEEDDNLLSK